MTDSAQSLKLESRLRSKHLLKSFTQLTVWMLIAMSRRVFSVIGPGPTTNLGVLPGNYSTSHAQFLL